MDKSELDKIKHKFGEIREYVDNKFKESKNYVSLI